MYFMIFTDEGVEISNKNIPLLKPPATKFEDLTREQKLDVLNGQAEAIKRELDQVEAQIHDLEVNK
jgi:hypothetical protein